MSLIRSFPHVVSVAIINPGAHVQRGLLYLSCVYVCVYVCMCVCVPTHICRLTHWNQKREIPTDSVRYRDRFKLTIFLKMLRSKVMV